MIAKNQLLSLISLLLLSVFHLPFCHAGKLIIHNGGSLTITSGSLDLGCSPATIENGGSFTINGGELKNKGRFTIEVGGKYNFLTGKVEKCYKTYYVIPAKGGGGSVICL